MSFPAPLAVSDAQTYVCYERDGVCLVSYYICSSCDVAWHMTVDESRIVRGQNGK
jgi:hypothetical protein